MVCGGISFRRILGSDLRAGSSVTINDATAQ
jgi:hypothetical protein